MSALILGDTLQHPQVPIEGNLKVHLALGLIQTKNEI